MKLKVPFPIAKAFIVEKWVDFTFKIATLEIATKEILNCDLWNVSEKSPAEVNVAILYAGYITARKDLYDKPFKLIRSKKYTEADAAFWLEHMSEKTKIEFLKAVDELLGEMKGGSGKQKKK
jgi:hypothetical protein